MELCHSNVYRVPTFRYRPTPYHHSAHATLGHLIRIIEQLKNKDKIISHLEKELGQTAGYALSLQLDRNHQNKMSAATLTAGTDRQLSFSSPLKHSQALKKFSLDNSLYENKTEDSLELETESNQSDDSILDKQAVKKLKDLEERHKSLKERNRKFLEKNVELTSQNRNLTDQISSLTEENGKIKEQAEHSKRKSTVYARQLSQEKLKLVNMELQLSEFEKLKQELSEQAKTITSLKQACSEKDRRMELIQHHKKRSKLRRSQERCCGVKETFYGYDEDDRSLDSENSLSLSSASHGTDDDELWDELSREEREKNYQKLMKEHLQLERSHTLLLKQTDSYQDPQRSRKLQSDLEHNLILSQGRIEELEQVLRSSGKDDICDLLKEKERLNSINETLHQQLQDSEKHAHELEEDLNEKKEQIEDMEFQILEFQESEDGNKTPKISQGEDNQDESNEALLREQLSISMTAERAAKMEIEELRHEIASLLEGRGKDVDVILQKLDAIKNSEQQIEELEETARELQAKVICLQQDKTTLEEQLSVAQKQEPAHEPIINQDAPDLNQMEMLNLKAQISAHENSELELMEKNIFLQEKLAEFEIAKACQSKQLVDLENKLKSYKNKLAALQKSPPSSKQRPETDQHFRTVSKEIEKLVEKAATIQASTRPKTRNFSHQADLVVKINSSDEVKSLEKQLQKMHEENIKLKQKLERKMLDYDSDKSSDDERESRIGELESVCEELKERSYSAELAERQIREQLKLAEQTINELEASEGQLREKSEQLRNRDNEAKKHVQELHHIVQEMKDIIQEKDIVEYSLREKVQFLEKVEAASNQQISELKASEKYLQEQLEVLEKQQTDPYLVDEMKQHIEELTIENKRLVTKVAELEEEEEILRENWRKVAAEDAKRAFNQQEKVQLLELMNRELKTKLSESQEAAALSILNNSSLAMELSESQCESDLPEQTDEISDLNLKIRHLEDELLEVTEIKNNKIELLQERIAKYSENEIKLSETVMEFEVAEAELKSKLAFYETSQVTVEKILDYEDKLHELRSSQEDLLEQLHSLENHEEDLQQKLERTEKENKAKISRLETEISNYKEREKASKTKIRNLEKHEEELMEKVTKFGICEKRLQDKIDSKEVIITELKQKMEEKTEKIRELSATKTEMFNQISKLLDKEKHLNEKISELEGSVLNYKDLVDTNSGSVESMKKQYEQQIDKMEIHTKTQSDRILQLENSISSDSESTGGYIEHLEKENINVKRKLESLNHKSIEKVEHLETKLNQLGEREKEHLETISSQNIKLSESRSELAEKESRLAEMTKSDEKLKDNVKYLEETVVKGLENEVQELQSEVSSLNKEINDISCEKSDLTTLQERLKKEIKENKYWSQTNSQLENDLEKIKSYCQTLKNKLDNMEEKTKELSEIRDKAESNLLQKQEECNQLQKKIEVLLDAKCHLMDKVSELEELESRMSEQVDQLRNAKEIQPEERKQQLESLSSPRLESLISQKRDSVGASSDTSENELSGSLKLGSLFQRVQCLEAEKEELSSKLLEATSAQSSLQALKDKNRLLEDSEDKLMERVMELEENEERLRREINSLKDDSDLELVAINEKELKRSIDKLNYEKQNLDAELNLIEGQLEEEKQRSSKLKEKLTNLEKNESSAIEKLASLEISCDDLRNQLSSMEEKLKLEKSKCLNNETKIKSLVKDLDEANEKLKKEKEQSLESLKTVDSTLKKTIQELSEEKSEIEQRSAETEQALREERGKLEIKLREQKLNFENLQKSKIQLEEESAEVAMKAEQLQKDLTTTQYRLQSLQTEHENQICESKKQNGELRDKLKEKTRIELDLKKKVQSQEKLLIQNQTDSEELDQKCGKLEKEIKELSTTNSMLKEKAQHLEEELCKYLFLDEEYNSLKVIQSESSTEMEILKEKMSDYISLKSDYETVSKENNEKGLKVETLEKTFEAYQKLQVEHHQLLTAYHESQAHQEELGQKCVELDDLKQKHKVLTLIHNDSEQKLKSVKDMLIDFENLKQKHAEILQVKEVLESCVDSMIKAEEHENILKELNISHEQIKDLKQELAEVAEKTFTEAEEKNSIKIKSLEDTIKQFSTLKDEYKSLLKIHHSANLTITELEEELAEIERKKEITARSTQTDAFSSLDMSCESAVFSEGSENDSPTHRPILHKTEDRTSFKDTPLQSHHSLSLSSRQLPYRGETITSSSSVKSYILSKPKNIGLPSKKYNTESSNSDAARLLEQRVKQLEGENSRLHSEIEEKTSIIHDLQTEMTKTIKIHNEIKTHATSYSYQKSNKDEEKKENSKPLLTSSKLQEKAEGNSQVSSSRSSVSPDGERVKSSFLKNKIKFFESGSREKTEEDTMLDKPEDVLRQQMADMDCLRQQVADLEKDRDKLHDNARKDKQIIHDQHIQISELQLSEKMLKEQVNSITHSERDLYEKCSELEDQIAKQEDEIHELQILERRLRELVRKLKLDEEQWMTKSENMVANMEDLTNSESTLKSKISELEKDNSKKNDRLEYYELRLKEVESSEMKLSQKLKHYENMESRLEAKLRDLENCKTAANSQATELDIVSTDLESRLERALEENNILSRHVSELRNQTRDIDRQLLKSKDNELGLKQQVASLEKSETVIQKRIKEFELREIDNRAENRELLQTIAILKDRISALQRSENRLKYKIQEFELTDIQGSTPIENQKLPEKTEECHTRIVQLQDLVAQLKKCVNESVDHSDTEIQGEELWEETEKQLKDLKKLNHHLNSLVQRENNGKEISGREVDIANLNRRLESYQDLLLRLKQNLLRKRGPSMQHPDSGVIQGSSQTQPGGLPLMETKRVMRSVRGLTTPTGEATVEGAYIDAPCRIFDRQSVDNYGNQSDVLAHEEQYKRDTSGVYLSPRKKSASKEAKERLIQFNDAESSRDDRRRDYTRTAKPANAEIFDVSNGWKSVAKATSLSQPHQGKGEEELVIGLTLPSESEGQSANDTDSAMSSPEVPLARRHTAKNSSAESLAPPLPKSLPPTLPAKTVFAQDSYYLPSFDKGAVCSSEGEMDNDRLVSPVKGKDMRVPSSEHSALHPSDNVFVSTHGNQYLTEKPAPVRNLSSLDSVADSGRGTVASNVGQIQNLVDKIGFIEKQLQTKPEGSETEEESLFSWKAKASDQAQQLELLSSENRLMKNEISQLEKELEEKNRYISTLDQWLHSFDDIFKNKDIRSDRDIIQQLQSNLVQVKDDLKNSGTRKGDLSNDPAALQTELNSKSRELSTKRQEVEALLKEIKCWQEECQTIETMRSNALDSLRALEMEAMELQDVHSNLSEMRMEYDSLRGQMDKVKALTEEAMRLSDRVRDLENEKASFQTVKEEYDNLRARFDENESSKNKAITEMVPLKAKIAQLSQKCQEKNSLIHRLMNEVQSKGGKSVLLDELRRLEVAMTDVESDVECSTNILPVVAPRHMTSRFYGKKATGRTSPDTWSSASSVSDVRDLLSDTELISSPEIRLPQRPRSAESSSKPRHTRRHFVSKFEHPTPNENLNPTPEDPQLFIALADYNPQLFSRSRKPWLELPLKEGDRVKVIGQLNNNGYYEAEVNNQKGLVPAQYLQPLQHSPEWYHSTLKQRSLKNLQSTPRNLEGSPENIVDMFHQLNQVQPLPRQGTNSSTQSKSDHGNDQTTQTKGQSQTTTTTQTFFNIPLKKSSASTQAEAPDPPTNFKVQKLINGSSIMLSWTPPVLNEMRENNGSQVTGYRIYCNGQIRNQSLSPLLAKAVIENIDVKKQHKFAIQTMAANGLVSTSVSVTFDGVTVPSSGSESDHESDADLSSVFSKISRGQGPKRKFIGVYDYNPLHHSRKDLTGQELSFQTGDEITVFGHQRPDGFYHAELNGKKGLVPARFVEELPSSPSKNAKSTRTHTSGAQPHHRSVGSLPSRRSLPTHTRPH